MPRAVRQLILSLPLYSFGYLWQIPLSLCSSLRPIHGACWVSLTLLPLTLACYRLCPLVVVCVILELQYCSLREKFRNFPPAAFATSIGTLHLHRANLKNLNTEYF